MKVFCRLSLSLIMFGLVWPLTTLASDNYPKLANYYLSFFDRTRYADLARWDMLILQPDTVHYQASFFKYFRQQNPSGRLVAYTYPAMYYRLAVFYDYFGFRQRLFRVVNKNNWWLRDARGAIVESWPNMSVVNLTNPLWRDFNLNYLNQTYGLSQFWDGIFVDMVDARADLYNQLGIDIDGDGRVDSNTKVNRQWQAAMANYLIESRLLWPNKIIVINGNSLPCYQGAINGRMFEDFPTPWEGAGTWTDSMKQYLRQLPELNLKPNFYIINTAYQPDTGKDFYAQMRFGLTSALLGDGYFSFDGGASSHAQIWWFDEYNVRLGASRGSAVNLLAPQSATITAGLWRRDFEHGLVLVNSTAWPQVWRSTGNDFKRLKGWQDVAVNNGEPVSELVLCPMSGIILLRSETPQPDLSGTYLMSYDYEAAGVRGNWLAEARAYFKIFKNKLAIWFKYYYYGQHKN